MTVAELRAVLRDCPDDMRIGVPDQDDVVCEVQFAGMVSHHATGEPFFLLRANGGVYLCGEER